LRQSCCSFVEPFQTGPELSVKKKTGPELNEFNYSPLLAENMDTARAIQFVVTKLFGTGSQVSFFAAITLVPQVDGVNY
jgi:hypothetical protein